MQSKLITIMQRIQGWRLWLIFTIATIFFAELVVACMDFLLNGEVSGDYLLTGLVAAGFVAPASLALMTYLLDEVARSQRDALEAGVIRTEGLLSSAIDAAQMVFWEFDLVSDRLLFREDELRFLGIESTEIAHNMQTWLANIHPDDIAPFMQRFRIAMEPGGLDFDFEYRIKQKPGAWIWIRSRGRVTQRDELGRPLRAAGGSINIDAQKLAEAELRDKEVLLRTTLESTDEGILMIAEDGRVLSANRRFLELWQVPQTLADAGKDELLLAHVLDQLLDPDRFLNQVRRLYGSDDEARDFVYFKDGRVFSRFSRALTIGAERGRIWCFKDITKQSLIEDELQLTKERYDFATMIGKVGMWDWNPLTGVLAWSDETFRLMGFEPASVIPTYELYLDLVHPDDRVPLNDAVQATLQGRKPYSLDCRIVRDGGEEIVCHVTGKVEFDADGQPVRMLGTIQDVTERKRAEIALRNNEERLRLALSAARQGWFDIDLPTGEICVSPEYAKMIGYDPEEFHSDMNTWVGGLHPEDRENVLQAFAECLETGGPRVMQYRRHKKNGDWIWISSVGQITEWDAQRRPLRMVGIHADITERKQAEMALAESRGLLKTIIDTAPARIFWKDRQSRYLGCNPVFARDAGKDRPEELIGKDDYQMTWRDQAELYQADDRLVMESGVPKISYDEPQTTPDGQTIWLRTSKVPLRSPAGETIGILGIYEDITTYKRAESDLRDSEERAHNLANLLRLITDNVPDMIWAKDINKRYLFANKALCQQLLNATDTEEPLGKDDLFFALRERQRHPDNPEWHTFGELCQDSDIITLQKGKPSQFDEFGNVKGKFLFLDVHKAPFINDRGEVIGVVGSARDVTEQKGIEERLRLASLVLENSSEALMISDAKNRIVDINPAFTKLTGYELPEVLGKDPSMLHSGRHSSNFYGEMWKAISTTGHWQGEIWNKRKNGDVFAEWLTINTIYNDDGSTHRHVALFSDISEKKRSEELIWNQANFDQLTQLPNRRMFRDRLAQDLKKAHRAGLKLALLFLDLDRFKEINDTLGHDLGDKLLAETARRISACVRESDTVARLGGDEFTIILSVLEDPNSVERVAEDILKSLSRPFNLENDTVYISASIGITLYPDDAGNLEDLLKNADQAMYVAKNAGRGRFSYFTSAMQEAAQHRLRLLRDLRNAIPEGQLQLYYQPITELHTGQIHKAEALLRWFHPKRGMISPAEFIPLAEESGLIHEIGDWVFATAAKQALQWQSAYGEDFQISVNKSPAQIQSRVEITGWMNHLDMLGLPGKNIVVEITEGLLLDSSPFVTAELLAFRDAGIQVAIDDFGTGYSALSYLNKLDIDYVKIDQSFIRDMASDSSALALSEAIIVMAHKLGLQVIAEGVETTEQRDLLASFGCDYVQGYFYSRPVPAAEFELLLTDRKHAAV